ncbi:nitrous oxide reductase accessory protein NosL [Bacillus massiliigorillae]|uniref:nitrous oxide reductase accessory protein NosL n=1 Tax=Bacillus massiliigorillae TaxID=1243664 RepID=UPI0003A3BDA9|nr:nitrous oxide reductase accessory protein NosL [Bacillus massiliigorillae]
MKKLAILFLSAILMIFISACGDKEATNKETDKATDTPKVEKTAHENDPQEPHDQEKCAFCNMKVYARDDEMGEFTTQALTKDGKHLFFDDSGCLLNGPRKANEQYEKTWVRDANTKDWIESDKAIIVKSDTMTPMKYGYSFFSTQESADKFINDNKDKNAVIATWDDVEKVSNERYQMKMQNMKQHNTNHESESMHHDSETQHN